MNPASACGLWDPGRGKTIDDARGCTASNGDDKIYRLAAVMQPVRAIGVDVETLKHGVWGRKAEGGRTTSRR